VNVSYKKKGEHLQLFYLSKSTASFFVILLLDRRIQSLDGLRLLLDALVEPEHDRQGNVKVDSIFMGMTATTTERLQRRPHGLPAITATPHGHCEGEARSNLSFARQPVFKNGKNFTSFLNKIEQRQIP